MLEGLPGFHASNHAGGIPVFGIQTGRNFSLLGRFLTPRQLLGRFGPENNDFLWKNAVDALPSPNILIFAKPPRFSYISR